jgi:hypothetical protein
MQLQNNISLSISVIDGAIEYVKDKLVEEKKFYLRDSSSFNSNISEGKKLVSIIRNNSLFVDLYKSSNNDDGYINFLRQFLKEFLIKTKPPYLHAILNSRDEFIKALSQDEIQVFNYANLFKEFNLDDKSLCQWWDDIEEFARDEGDRDNLKTGRKGEEKTIEYEINQLKIAKIDKEPIWKARDSNRWGYDILSFRKKNNQIHEIYIESKCTKNSRGYFHITDKEWRTCSANKEKYFVYHWYINGSKPKIIGYELLEQNVAKNRGKGVWESLLIKITPPEN